ncbi:CPBP family intramembrane glutamic endopeptidase [Inediibacterium massiliense]|uniref:CPBP family intramembrane glutamic endopeptidase n=1 Tax=Inediibacterium massiliense TaxID=1658111 RepID=UPI0006B58D31|nr:type II CAAX endopeptidase family protein [Inediibacterium massiliense]
MEDFFESIKIRKVVGVFVLITIIVMMLSIISEGIFKRIEQDAYFWMIWINTILLFWFIYKVRKSNIKVKDVIYRFKEQIKWSEVFKIIIMDMSFSIGFVFFLLGLLLKINPNLAYKLLEEGDTNTLCSLIYQCIGAVLLAPIVEELLFRGVIFHRLKKRYSIGKAIIISSIAFGIMHMELAIVGAFVTGILLCLLYLKTKNILITMCAHFINNFIATLMQIIGFFMDSSSENEVFTPREIDIYFFTGLFLCIVAGYFVIKYVKKNWPKKVIMDEI